MNLRLHLHGKNGGRMFLQKVGIFLTDYTASHTMHTKGWSGNLKERDLLRYLDRDGRIFKLIFKKIMCIGMNCLMIASNWGFL
jgi:hypothetical protein